MGKIIYKIEEKLFIFNSHCAKQNKTVYQYQYQPINIATIL